MKESRKHYYNMPCDPTIETGIHVESLKEYQKHDPNDITIPHVHSYYEMIWFKEGGFIHTIDFREYEVQPNNVFFIAPGQIHSFRNYNGQEGILVKFCLDFIDESTQQEDRYIKFNIFNSAGHEPFCVINDDAIKGIEMTLELIHKENDQDAPGHYEMLRALTKLLFIHIHRNSTRNKATFLEEKRPSHRLFVKFRDMLEKDYRTKHMVHEYAAELNVSTKTLSNSIIECTGKAPLTFINDRLLLEAKRLLMYSNMMAREVAKDLGFEDPSYFSKFFKRETGVLPSAYKTTMT